MNDCEIIVVDDCSSDGTWESVQRRYSGHGRIELFRTERNSGGASKPRNLGMKQARGEYVSFLDSDDLAHPDRNRILASALDDHPDVGVVFCDYYLQRDGVNDAMSYLAGLNFLFSVKPYIAMTDSNGYLLNDKFYACINTLISGICTDTVMFRRELLHIVDDWFPEDISVCEDISFWTDLSMKSRVYYIDEPLAYYRLSDSSVTGNAWRRHDSTLRYHLRNYKRLAPLLDKDERTRYRRFLSRMKLRVALDKRQQGNKLDAAKTYLESKLWGVYAKLPFCP
jgi:glycosyltransferase involved in cell wall biosynthesis